MRRILKYTVWLDQIVKVPVPSSAKCVLFADQAGTLQVWFEVDDLPYSTGIPCRKLLIVATGEQVPIGAVHLGSCQQRQFVWHLYEVPA